VYDYGHRTGSFKNWWRSKVGGVGPALAEVCALRVLLMRHFLTELYSRGCLYTIRYRSGSMRRTVLVAVAIWIVSLLLAVPDLFGAYVDTSNNMPVCLPYHYDWGEWYTKFRVMFHFLVLFAVPLVIITVFYSAIAFTLLCRTPAETFDAAHTEEAVMRQLDSRRKVMQCPLLVIVIIVAFGPVRAPGV